jgi:ankyrin repeat protein
MTKLFPSSSDITVYHVPADQLRLLMKLNISQIEVVDHLGLKFKLSEINNNQASLEQIKEIVRKFFDKIISSFPNFNCSAFAANAPVPAYINDNILSIEIKVLDDTTRRYITNIIYSLADYINLISTLPENRKKYLIEGFAIEPLLCLPGTSARLQYLIGMFQTDYLMQAHNEVINDFYSILKKEVVTSNQIHILPLIKYLLCFQDIKQTEAEDRFYKLPIMGINFLFALEMCFTYSDKLIEKLKKIIIRDFEEKLNNINYLGVKLSIFDDQINEFMNNFSPEYKAIDEEVLKIFDGGINSLLTEKEEEGVYYVSEEKLKEEISKYINKILFNAKFQTTSFNNANKFSQIPPTARDLAKLLQSSDLEEKFLGLNALFLLTYDFNDRNSLLLMEVLYEIIVKDKDLKPLDFEEIRQKADMLINDLLNENLPTNFRRIKEYFKTKEFQYDFLIFSAYRAESNFKYNYDLLEEEDKANFLSQLFFCIAQTGCMRLIDQAYILGTININIANKKGFFPLFYAVFYNRIEMVESLLLQGADINKKFKDGSSFLHKAAQSGNLAMINKLLDNGAEISCNIQGFTPLHTAIFFENKDAAEQFLARGVDINNVTLLGSPIHVAIHKKRLDMIIMLLEKGADIKTKDKAGYTPLHRAVISSCLEAIEILLNKGADINAKTNNIFTPLHLAAGLPDLEALKILLNKGAKINIKNNNGLDPFGLAASRGNKAIIEEFLNRGMAANLLPAFVNTLHYKHLEVAKLLLNKDPSLVNGDNDLTPLNIAIKNKNLDMVKFLLTKGANVNIVVNNQTTIDIFAAQYLDLEIFKELLNHGINIDQSQEYIIKLIFKTAVRMGNLEVVTKILDKFGNNIAIDIHLDVIAKAETLDIINCLLDRDCYAKPIYNSKHIFCLAIKNKNLDLVKKLLKRGFDITPADIGSIIGLAIWKGGLNLVRELLGNKDNRCNYINMTITGFSNFNVITPLALAAQKGHLEIVKELLNMGALIDNSPNSFTPLHHAVKNGHLEVVKELLNKGADINLKTTSRYILNGTIYGNNMQYSATPLCYAIEEGNLEIVKELLDRNANTDISDKDLPTPFYLAVKLGRLDIVAEFLNRSIFPNNNKKFSEGWCPIHVAVYNKSLNMVIKILDKCPKDVNILTRDKDTPLHLAIQLGNLRIIEELLKRGADINLKNKKGYFPLHLGVQAGNLEVIKILLKKEALIDIEDKEGQTPLYFAIANKNLNIIKELLDNGADINKKYSPLLVLFKEHKNINHEYIIQILDLFAQFKVDLGVKDEEGNTMLHLAAKKGILNLVQYLLEKGIDPNIVNDNGDTPLHQALAGEQGEFMVEIVKALREKYANFNAQNNEGDTFLHKALRNYKYNGSIKELLDSKADVNISNKKGVTPLHIAARRIDIKQVEELLEKNANINALDEEGSTPFHYLCQGSGDIQDSKHLELLKLFIKHGANINAKNYNQRTILHFIAQSNVEFKKLDILKNLLESFDVNACDNKGITPLHLSIKKNNQILVNYFLSRDADVNACDNKGYTPLHFAAEHYQSVNLMLALLEKGANPNLIDNEDVTPLHLVAKISNCDKAIGSLIKKGAFVNALDNKGCTPLHRAAKSDGKTYQPIAELLKYGADVNIANNEGFTPLYLAVEKNKDIRTINLLLEYKANINVGCGEKKFTPLHIAAQSKKSNNFNMVESFLAKNANVNACDSEGNTPLHLAAKNYINKLNLKVITKLLEGDANFNAINNQGLTPLHIAVENNKLELVQTLLKIEGADIDLKQGKNGVTPLYLAVKAGNKKIIEELLKKNANPNIKCSNEQEAPLDIAKFSDDNSIRRIFGLPITKRKADASTIASKRSKTDAKSEQSSSSFNTTSSKRANDSSFENNPKRQKIPNTEPSSPSLGNSNNQFQNWRY